MNRSVHDHHLVSYEVDGRAKRIVLHTEYAYAKSSHEATDVVFEGVVDHYFRNCVSPSIMDDVKEVSTQFRK